MEEESSFRGSSILSRYGWCQWVVPPILLSTTADSFYSLEAPYLPASIIGDCGHGVYATDRRQELLYIWAVIVGRIGKDLQVVHVMWFVSVASRDFLRADSDDPLPTLRNQLTHLGRALRVWHRDGYVYNFSYPRPY